MTEKVERAQRIFDTITRRTGMSEDGKNWLIAVLDPMHDKKLECKGYPDREVSPSIIQTIRQSVEFSSPYASGDGANPLPWGAHIMLDDQMGLGTARWTNVDGNVLTTASSGNNATFPIGGCNIIGLRGTAPIYQYPDSTSGSVNKFIASQQVPAKYLNGKCRILSQGLEVINTTPELYRGGSLLVYEQPTAVGEASTHLSFKDNGALREFKKTYGEVFFERCVAPVEEIPDEKKDSCCKIVSYGKSDGFSWKPTGPNTVVRAYAMVNGRKVYAPQEIVQSLSAISVRYDNLPPDSQASALLLPGSKQWDSPSGAYLVQTMNDMENPPSFPDYTQTAYTSDESKAPIIYDGISPPGGTDDTNVWINSLTYPAYSWELNADTSVNVLPFFAQKRIPFNRKGVILTGLDGHSTFTVNINTIIERIPTTANLDLVVLGQPSPCEDYVAIQLYSEMVRLMPVGVEFKANDWGDWFLEMADQVANVVSAIGKPILKAVDDYREGRKSTPSQSAATYVSNASPKAMSPAVRKPLPAIPKKKAGPKSKPLPPTPKKKAKPLPPIPTKKK